MERGLRTSDASNRKKSKGVWSRASSYTVQQDSFSNIIWPERTIGRSGGINEASVRGSFESIWL